MALLHDKRFPNESVEYREARNKLLEAEVSLRRQLEEVASLRRQLPRGGKVQTDYVFETMTSNEEIGTIRLLDLFTPGKSSLIIYSMMFHPDEDAPCPLCNSIIDGLNGSSPHVNDKTNFIVVGKAPIEKLHIWSQKRGWKNIRLYSSFNNSYNEDYFAENAGGSQNPMLNVFQKVDDEIYHFYGTELFFVKPEEGQDPRHVDLIWPIWQLFDLTPEGRGKDWYPQIDSTT